MKKSLNYIENLLARLFDRVHQSSWVGETGLSLYRIFFGLFLLICYLPYWDWVGDVPQAFYYPHLLNIGHLFDGFPPKFFFTVLDVLVLLLLAMVVLGIFSKISLLVLFFLNCIGYAFAYSIGKIDHGTTLYIFSLLVLGLSNCGTRYALVPDRPWPVKVQQAALSGLSIIIVFGLFTAGLPKLVEWFDFDLNTSGFLSWYYPGYYMFGRHYLLADSVQGISYGFFEVADYLAASLEVFAFVFLLAGRRFWRLFLILLGCFHLGNLLLLNIEFTLNATAYGIFLVPPFLYHFFGGAPKSPNKTRQLWILILVTIIVVVRLVLKWLPVPENAGAEYYEGKLLASFYWSIFAWLMVLITGIVALVKKWYVPTKHAISSQY